LIRGAAEVSNRAQVPKSFGPNAFQYLDNLKPIKKGTSNTSFNNMIMRDSESDSSQKGPGSRGRGIPNVCYVRLAAPNQMVPSPYDVMVAASHFVTSDP